MLAAEVKVITSGGFVGFAQHVVPFDDLETAKGEYERIADLLVRRNRKANDLPDVIELANPGEKVRFRLDDLHSVSFVDFAYMNKQRSGVKEAFPNLF